MWNTYSGSNGKNCAFVIILEQIFQFCRFGEIVFSLVFEVDFLGEVNVGFQFLETDGAGDFVEFQCWKNNWGLGL